MAAIKRKASEENPKKINTEVLWSDDEIQLLLQTLFSFKSKCEFEELSWESVRSKYEQIFEKMSKEYPEDPEKLPNKSLFGNFSGSSGYSLDIFSKICSY